MFRSFSYCSSIMLITWSMLRHLALLNSKNIPRNIPRNILKIFQIPVGFSKKVSQKISNFVKYTKNFRIFLEYSWNILNSVQMWEVPKSWSLLRLTELFLKSWTFTELFRSNWAFLKSSGLYIAQSSWAFWFSQLLVMFHS